jgi:hypothetical protein
VLTKFLLQTDNLEGLEKLGEAQPNTYPKALMSMASATGQDGKVKTTAILVLLLRLRQICCHPNLLWNVSGAISLLIFI